MHTTDYAGRGNAAYDLERFHSRSKRRRVPKLVVTKSPRSQIRARAQLSTAFRVAAVAMLMVGFIIAMLYSRAMLSELNGRISAAQGDLNKEVTETNRLATEVEAKLSLRNVEEYATQKLGMAVMDKSQYTYINLSEGDMAELTNESPKKSLLDEINLLLRDMKAYIDDR